MSMSASEDANVAGEAKSEDWGTCVGMTARGGVGGIISTRYMFSSPRLSVRFDVRLCAWRSISCKEDDAGSSTMAKPLSNCEMGLSCPNSDGGRAGSDPGVLGRRSRFSSGVGRPDCDRSGMLEDGLYEEYMGVPGCSPYVSMYGLEREDPAEASQIPLLYIHIADCHTI
jgi:hypothetical protein